MLLSTMLTNTSITTVENTVTVFLSSGQIVPEQGKDIDGASGRLAKNSARNRGSPFALATSPVVLL